MKKVITKNKLAVLTGIVLLAGVMYTAYFIADPEVIELTPASRAALKGNFIKLKNGTANYSVKGENSPNTVIFLHGSTIAMWDFDLQEKTLINNGYKSVRFDFFGKGFSDRPDIKYDRKLYTEQLLDILDSLKINEKTVIVAHSLGGAIAADFTAKYKSRVKGLFLISPVINSVTSIPPFIVCNTPVLGPFVYRFFMSRVLKMRAAKQWDGNVKNSDYYNHLFEKQTEIKGFQHAVCSMFQTDLTGDYTSRYLQLDTLHIPVTILYGSNDRVIGLDNINFLKNRTQNIKFIPVAGAGHSAHVEKQKYVDRELLDFLKDIYKEK
ncbi:MAG: alpha/beta hydrolase [Deltaproteobacteria bacterium]|nr:alpha/beta hydrolase [Deltaproteobacteria bacterium]